MISVTYCMALILIFIRVTTFFAFIPVIFPKGLPNILKVGIGAMFAFFVIPGVNYASLSSISTTSSFIAACVCELVTGIILGFIVNLCFDSAMYAGQLIDIQIGFGMLSMYDPNSQMNSTLVQSLLYWFALITFLITDGHHILIAEIITSFDNVKLGTFILSQKTVSYIINVFVNFFVIGLKIAIPIVLTLLITDLTLGLIARTVPQINVMILELPIKIVIGLGCIAFALPIIAQVISDSFKLIPEAIKGVYKFIPLVFVFAADEKTEEATPRKQQKAREKGQVPKSKDVNLAFTLLACTLSLAMFGSYLSDNLLKVMKSFLTQYMNINFSEVSVQNVILFAIVKIMTILLPFVILIMCFGVASNFFQTGFIFTSEPLKFDLAKLNPISGFKRIFSLRSVVELIKDTAVVAVVGYVGYDFIKSNIKTIIGMSDMNVNKIITAFNSLAVNIFFRITLIMIAIALIDFMYEKFQYRKDLRMTKQEIKEEYKQDEGDPQIKSKRRQMQREMASKRMMQNVPKATVVVTNPTHVAVALRYDDKKDEAPVLVAKGLDYIALKIKDIAKENDIPIIENKPLARLIYKEVEIDSEIPQSMYSAVAELLAVVLKLKKKK